MQRTQIVIAVLLLAGAVCAAESRGVGLEFTAAPIPGVPLIGSATVGHAAAKAPPGAVPRCLEAPPGVRRTGAIAAPPSSDGGTEGWVVIKSEDFKGSFPNEWENQGQSPITERCQGAA